MEAEMDTNNAQQNAITLAVLQTEVAYLKAAQAQTNSKLDEVLRTMNEARGGWRTLMAVGGAAGTLGGAITWLFSHWRP
jgi:hypothetical protein